ncbi:MAG: hypothetical protein Q8S18_09295 [Bacteroidales bacterium]|nr:hypothetical protein [Bacteroidales bacterium]
MNATFPILSKAGFGEAFKMQLGAGLPARAAAVAVNGSLLNNTSGASAKSKIVNRQFYPDCVFSKLAEWVGLTCWLDLLFLLHQGKRKLNYQKILLHCIIFVFGGKVYFSCTFP